MMTRVAVVVAQIDSWKHLDHQEFLREPSTLQSFRYLEGMLYGLNAHALRQQKVDMYRPLGSASIYEATRDINQKKECCMYCVTQGRGPSKLAGLG